MSDGAVKVAVRVRPMNNREKERNAELIVEMKGNMTILKNPNKSGVEDDLKKFTFDHSYWSFDKSDGHYTTQDQVFKDLGSSVLDSAFDGFNACIFAYGQTGAGKSYTMMGYGDDVGLVPRICGGIFDRISTSDERTRYSASVSYLEIYNEKVRDLLVKGKGGANKDLKVREHPQTGPFVDGLTLHEVTGYTQIEELMELGNSNRTTAATGMNDTSSRSHALFTIQFTSASFLEGVPTERTAKINLVDLAGSERANSTQATGARLQEGSNINKSLTTLGLCIQALAERSAKKGKGAKEVFIPFRDSVLTWLLRESLGGNSKTIMVAAISPADINYGETLSTLHYANRAKNIINKPVVNEDPNVRLIKELRAEVERLKSLIGGDDAISKLEAKRQELRAKVDAAATEEEKEEALAELEVSEKQLEEAKHADKTALAEKIAVSEKMMSALTSTFESKWSSMTKLMDDRSLALREAGRAVHVESEQPHLVSLNLDDPLATGVVLYYLHQGKTTVGKKTEDAPADGAAAPAPGGEAPLDISLVGNGIMGLHCTIEYDGADKVVLVPEANARTIVNGVLVTEPLELHQGNTVHMGANTIFRFNNPAEAARMRKLRKESSQANIDSLATPDKSALGGMESSFMSMSMSGMEASMMGSTYGMSAKEQEEAAERAEAEKARLEEQREADKQKMEELERLLRAKEEADQQRQEQERREREEADRQKAEEQAKLAGEQAKMAEELARLQRMIEEKDQALHKAREEALLEEETKRVERDRELEEKQAKWQSEEMERIRKETELESQRSLEAVEALVQAKLAQEKKRMEEEASKREDEIRRKTEEKLVEEKKKLEAELQKAASKGGLKTYDELWKISIPKHHTRGDPRSSDGYIVYEVCISLMGVQWTIYRRYREFHNFHDYMKVKLPIVKFIKFPGKKSLSSFLNGPVDPIQRRRELEAYLRELISKTYLMADSPFFNVDPETLKKRLPFFRQGEGLAQK